MTEARAAPGRIAWIGEPLPPVDLSFEFFPPKSEAATQRFWAEVERLQPLKPRYVSVTCGAGGNPAEGTAALVDELRTRARFEAAAHLTCACAPTAVVDEIAAGYRSRGVGHIVALRGDAPRDGRDLSRHYAYAVDLVRALAGVPGFEISVAAYPEVHPEARSAEADLDNLKAKLDAGARRAITQYCFDCDTILRFHDRMRAAGIAAPLAVGILPIHDFVQVRRFSERCGASVPPWLCALYEGLEQDPGQQALLGASLAAEQARRLIAEGIREFHFYTLNRAELTVAACRLLGLRPALAAAA
jgi:methylenetetrahydrofolate reductase (NADPH)